MAPEIVSLKKLDYFPYTQKYPFSRKVCELEFTNRDLLSVKSILKVVFETILSYDIDGDYMIKAWVAEGNSRKSMKGLRASSSSVF